MECGLGHQLLPGDRVRVAAGRDRAVPDLEPTDTVLSPTLFGWNVLVKAQSQSESFWLAFVVMLHVGSALGLLAYYWRDWVQIVRAFFRTLSTRRNETSTERLAWLIILASVPAGVIGLALEHPLRTLTAKPEIAAIFLIVNGGVLLAAERFRRRAEVRELAIREGSKPDGARTRPLEYREAFVVGIAQSTALVAGISRDGVTMGAGSPAAWTTATRRASRFCSRRQSSSPRASSSCPTCSATWRRDSRSGAGGVRGRGGDRRYHGRFLVGYFKTRTLTPFAIYCLLFGVAMVIYTHVGAQPGGGLRSPPGARHHGRRCPCREPRRRCSRPQPGLAGGGPAAPDQPARGQAGTAGGARAAAAVRRRRGAVYDNRVSLLGGRRARPPDAPKECNASSLVTVLAMILGWAIARDVGRGLGRRCSGGWSRRRPARSDS